MNRLVADACGMGNRRPGIRASAVMPTSTVVPAGNARRGVISYQWLDGSWPKPPSRTEPSAVRSRPT